jgi:exopolyphosphatase/guanosine-5'-triphosphate,3'-diphosphate pyrophosphatase
MARYATIDVGSHSILMHVAGRDELGHWKLIADKAKITRLGEGFRPNGLLESDAMDRTVKALCGFMESARRYRVDLVAAVGTMCLRTAKNTDAFLQRVKRECGLTIEVISGEEEARLAYVAAKSGVGLSEGRSVVFDVGGGSTELIFGNGEQVEHRVSIDIGAMTLTERHLTSDPVKKEEFEGLFGAIEASLEGLAGEGEVDILIGMGGTVTNVGAVMHRLPVYEPDRIQGSVLPLTEVERQMELYRSKTVKERKAVIGLQPQRADVILAGVGIVHTVMKKFRVDSAIISDWGIRHGLMVDQFRH